MKRFLFLSMLIFIVVMIFMSVHEKEDHMPLPQKLEQAIRLTRMKAGDKTHANEGIPR